MSRARTMQAAYIDQVGGPIRIGALPVPRPGPTDVRVQVAASGVNHVDLFVRSGAYRTHTPLPFVIGRDAVGTVVEVGAGATGVSAEAGVHPVSRGAAATAPAVPIAPTISVRRLTDSIASLLRSSSPRGRPAPC